MTNEKNHEIRLTRRPTGLPELGDFVLAETDVPVPVDGQVLVRNSYISVDPYMRGRMVDRPSYAPPFQLGETLTGGAVGYVVASKSARFSPGDVVQSQYGWREWYVAAADRLEKIDSPRAPIHVYLGALGMTGLTAWVGLLEIAALKPGERVFISAASGAVGSVACQIAKARGCYVVGSVGSTEKARYLREELGVDAAIEYKAEADLARAVAERFTEGIDVYFDNVGGSHLQAALGNMRQFGRVAACGMIEQYNASAPVPGPNNLAVVVGKRLTIRGFLVSDHGSSIPAFQREMTQWIDAGQMRWRDTIVDGIAAAPAAFIGLFKGENIGKMLVRVGPDGHA